MVAFFYGVYLVVLALKRMNGCKLLKNYST